MYITVFTKLWSEQINCVQTNLWKNIIKVLKPNSERNHCGAQREEKHQATLIEKSILSVRTVRMDLFSRNRAYTFTFTRS